MSKRKIVAFKPVLFLCVPLIVSVVTHLWNPLGFPSIHADEGMYMERAMRVLQGGGPQVPLGDYGRPYDHPYFSQIFLASIFGIINYPGSVKSDQAADYVESLYFVPRVLLGIIAFVDTFLVYKISERRYNEKVAFTAAILFAVMPLSWLTRRLYIDPLQLPFILLAILFAVYLDKMSKNNNRNLISIAFLSGIFLGLAIFTKIPAVCMIPLVGYLVFKVSSTNNKRNRNVLVFFFVPVLLIPGIWPAFAIFNGQFDNWYKDLVWQTGREGSIKETFNSILKMDPVLILVGLTGFAYAIFLKRDQLILLWVIPFVILFSYFIGRMVITFWVPMIPAFCIAAGILIDGLINSIKSRSSKNDKQSRSKIPYYIEEKNTQPRKKPLVSLLIRQPLLYTVVLTAIAVTGLISTLMLITADLNSSYFDLYTFIILLSPDTEDSINTTEVLMVASGKLRSFAWIPKYVVNDGNNDFEFRQSPLKEIVQNKKVILLSDDVDFERYMQSNPKEYAEHKSLYNRTYQIGEFRLSQISTMKTSTPIPI